MRILFLSPYVPSAIRIRPYSWIRALAGLGHQVHLVALRPPEDAWAPDEELRRICATVEVFPLSRGRTLLNAAVTLPTGRPLQLAYARCPSAQRHVTRLAGRGGFDVVHVEHLRGVALAAQLHGIPVVWDAVDSISALFAETAQFAPGRAQRMVARFDGPRTRRFEARAPGLFDRVLVTSSREAAAFERLAGHAARDRVAVIPNGVDTDYFRPAATGVDGAIVFSGKLSYHANEAAALRLVRRIMPLVWARRPGTPVVIAGKDPSEAIRALAADSRVTVTGFVPDLRTVLARAAVSISPLVYGAGIQNKVLEAMACGVPVITTSAAGAALSAVPDREVLLADDDAGCAEAACRLLADAPRRRAIGDAGRAYVEREHQWPRLCERLVHIYAEAGARRSAA